MRSMSLLNKLEKCHGSQEAIAAAVSGVHGVAACLNSAGNRIYFDSTNATFKNAKSLSINFDESGYGGLSVNVGIAMDICAKKHCHLKPQVVNTNL